MLSPVSESPVAASTANVVMTGATHDRALRWLELLSSGVSQPVLGASSVRLAELLLGEERAVGLAVVRDAENLSPRARNGEMGLEQAWTLASFVRSVIAEDRDAVERRPLIVVVDTPGQAFGNDEEARCLSMACAASVEAYAAARSAGHTVLTLVVGRAISGAFLAHGLQADAIVALEEKGVMMHAMSARSIARITRRTLAQVEKLAETVKPMSYAIADAFELGILDELLEGVSADEPTAENVMKVKSTLAGYLNDVRAGKRVRRSLAENPFRKSTVSVQQNMGQQWAAADAKLLSS